MSIFYSSHRRRPADYQTQRPNNPSQSMLNQLYGLQQGGYNRGPEYRNQHTRRPQHHNAVAYDPVVHRQYTRAYQQMPSARPTSLQYGPRPHMERHNIDYQQYNPDYSEDSEGSSTAAVVGSHTSQPSFAPQRAHHNPYATTQASDPYIQPARSQLQHEPPIDHGVTYSWTTGLVPEQYYGSSHQHDVHNSMAAQTNDPYVRSARSQHRHELPIDHGVTHSWTTRPASGGYNAPSYQQGSHSQHPLNLHASAPSMPNMNSGPVPTSYNNRPQARFDPAQAMTVPPPEMYAPAPAPAPTFLPTNHLAVPVQPQSTNVPYAAAYQSYPPPPVNDPSGGGLSTNNAVDQDHCPRVNDNESILHPMPVSSGTTRPPKKHRRGKGKGKGKERTE